jgi:hypothetical protein
MKTSFFSEAAQNATSYSNVSALIQTANLALFKAVGAMMWKHRAATNLEQRKQEVVDYFGISQVPSTSGYEALERSSAEKWAEAWVSLCDIAVAAARSGECGKALEKLMTPAQVAAKFGKAEPEAIDPAILGLSPELAQAFSLGAAKSAEQKNLRDLAHATEGAKEIDLIFRSLRGNAQVDLYAHELGGLVQRYHDQLKDGLLFGLENGFYQRGGKVDPNRAGELVLAQEQLKVAELTRKYLDNYTPADDVEDFDATTVDHSV